MIYLDVKSSATVYVFAGLFENWQITEIIKHSMT